ncbi:MAG: transglycosylase SLT domain-containing protein [Candidatus Moranbacteria bacterium]|nr:transglycosylase SLT domain-containing protein [Candidatus Moranbacteria bacterium]
MKYKKKISVFFLAVIFFTAFFSFFHPVLADSSSYKNQEKIPGSEQTGDFIQYMKDIINFGYAIIGILALFMLIIAAYQYLIGSTTGNVSGAKETVGSAILGLVLGLCAYIILNTINPDLVSFRSITQIKGVDQPITVYPNTTGVSEIYGAKTAVSPAPTTAARVLQYLPLAQAAHEKNPIVPVSLILAMIDQESQGNPNAVSPKGAVGLMQIMPKYWAADYGVTTEQLKDPETSITVGTNIIANLINKYNGNINLALAAYNAGTGNVDKYGGIPPLKETQEYVPKVTAKEAYYAQKISASQ